MPTLLKRFLIITGLILVAIFIATKILNKKIQNKLDALGVKSENLSLNLFNRSASLENITYQKDNDSIHIERLSVSSFRVLKFFTSNKIELGEIFILNPTVVRTVDVDTIKESTSDNSKNFEEIKIHNLTISHLNFKQSGKSHLKTTADIELIDFTLTRELAPSLKSVSALIENFSYTPKDSLHIIQVRSLSLNSSTDSLRVDSFKVTPNYSKATFGKKGGFQTDRLEITIPSILISGFSGSSLKDSLLSISRVEIPSSGVSVFRDKRQPFNENQRRDLPADLLRKLPIDLVIDSILIKNSKIVYEEQPETSEKTVEIIFADLQASMSGINTSTTNDRKYATLVASSKFMNDGLIDAKFQIPLITKIPHTATGSVTNLSLSSLNSILANIGRITIEKGTLQQLQFSFYYDTYTAKGDVKMTYKDFKLKVLDASNKKDETLSSLINLVINNDKVQTKHGLIDIERDRKRFIFNLWWKALSNGIKNSINPLKSDKRK
jgi:hypothetical protein